MGQKGDTRAPSEQATDTTGEECEEADTRQSRRKAQEIAQGLLASKVKISSKKAEREIEEMTEHTTG